MHYCRAGTATVPVEKASKFVGKTVKLNFKRYRTLVERNMVIFALNPNHPAQSVTIRLTGKGQDKYAERNVYRQKS